METGTPLCSIERGGTMNEQKEQFDRSIQEEKQQMLKKQIIDNYQAITTDDNGKQHVNPPLLAKILLREDNNHYLVISDNQDIIRYNGSFYDPKAVFYIESRINYYCDTLTTNRIKAETIGFIKSNEYIEREKLEQPPNLINAKNGIIDINTGELLPHDPNNTFMYEIPTSYDKNATCQTWDKFLTDVLYQEDISFFQEMCGYMLYRAVPFAILVILLGHGRNGKTTGINVISKVLGEDNIEHIPLQTLAHERFAKAKLYQKHANLCSEIGAHEIKDTATIKSLTGGDKIFARELYKSGFNFTSYAKLMFSCNILPDIGDKTLSMTERLAVIEFPNTFERGTEECDPFIYDKLTTPEELSGILNWMIAGLKRLLNNKKFSPYRDFENVTEYLRVNQDPVKMFNDQYLEQDVNMQVHKETVYKKYLEYIEKNKMPSLTSNWFGRKLKQLGYHCMTEGQPLKGGHKETWKGIKFRDGNDNLPLTDDKQTGLEV
jgi:putative DNA primase/helicase